jgi:hypothetical protein
MKETLDLWRVQIQCDDLADANDFQKIGYHSRHDRFPSAMPPVSPSVTKERHDSCNARGAGAAAGIGESQKLGQVIVDRRRGRLDEEDLLAAYGF